MRRIEAGGVTHEFPDEATDADISTALNGPSGNAVMEGVKKYGGMVGQELVATPGRMVSGATSKAKDLLDTILNPKMGTMLPLALPGGGTVLSRIASMGAGSMLDEPSPTYGGNLATAAKGSAIPALLEAAIPGFSKLVKSTGWGGRSIARADAQRFGEAAGEVAPTLRPGTTAQELQRTAEGQGLARMNAAKEGVVQDITRQIPADQPYRGAGEINVPSLNTGREIGTRRIQTGTEYEAPRVVGTRPVEMPYARGEASESIRGAAPVYGQPKAVPQYAEAPITAGKSSFTIKEANDELSAIGDMMRGVRPLDPRYKDVDLKQAYGTLAQEIKQGIASAAGPQALIQWDASQAAQRAGRTVLGGGGGGRPEMLLRPNLFRQGEFTAAELQKVLKDPEARAAIAKGLGGNLGTRSNLDAYNKLVGSITRGAEPGMVDQLAGQAPGIMSGRGSYGRDAWLFRLLNLAGLPNASTKYVGNPEFLTGAGRIPTTMPPVLQQILDLVAQRGAP